MKKLIYMAGAIALITACNNGNNDAVEIEQLREEAIAVHDEIMPQISAFDRNTVKVDSLLVNLPQLKAAQADLDTAQVRSELTTLKNNLENATGSMTTWMMEFDTDPQDKTAAEIKTYYENEVNKVQELRQLFEEVSKESTDKLAPYQ